MPWPLAWTTWFGEDRLQPWKHFAPVAADFSDVDRVLKWLRAHPSHAESMAVALSQYCEAMINAITPLATAVLRLYAADQLSRTRQ